jgi:hypothetical protein
MSYVERVLQPGEVVRHIGSVHWHIYLPGLLVMLAAIVTITWAELGASHSIFWEVVAGLLALIALFLLIPEWFTWWTTEIAVTNHRIIYKAGLIRRDTVEILMDKVESVDVDQERASRSHLPCTGRQRTQGRQAMASATGPGPAGAGRRALRATWERIAARRGVGHAACTRRLPVWPAGL